MSVKTVTVQDVIDAAKKNGLAWERRGSYFHEEYIGNYTYRITAACVLGQAAYNLGVEPDYLDQELGHIAGSSSTRKITIFNDKEATSYEEAVALLEQVLTPFADSELDAVVRDYGGRYPGR